VRKTNGFGETPATYKRFVPERSFGTTELSRRLEIGTRFSVDTRQEILAGAQKKSNPAIPSGRPACRIGEDELYCSDDDNGVTSASNMAAVNGRRRSWSP
jgi:hypothetical protein